MLLCPLEAQGEEAPVTNKFNLGEKALACLRFIDEKPTFWTHEWNVLCAKFNERAVEAKLLELVRRGYIEYGVSPRSGWLTEKGMDAIR